MLVFRTNINTAERFHRTACQLCMLLKGQGQWNVDMEDCDCVLRIETECVTEAAVIDLLMGAGLECSPLE